MDIDMKILLHAKDYIDDMARGKNPLTKEDVNEDDVINNIKISRCLLYVSDVLGAVADNGGIGRVKKEPLEALDIHKIELDKFEYSKEPIAISVIAQKINELKPDNIKKLKTTALTNWLVDINMLSIVQINGKNHKRPTANAESMGIFLEQRDGQYGPYYVVLYNEAAQHFIIDNLPAIIDGGYNDSQRKTEE